MNIDTKSKFHFTHKKMRDGKNELAALWQAFGIVINARDATDFCVENFPKHILNYLDFQWFKFFKILPRFPYQCARRFYEN